VVALAVVKVVLDLRNESIGRRDSSRAVVDDPLDEQAKAFLLRDAPSVKLVRVVTEKNDVGDASSVPPLFTVKLN
jgi:hypothetical protein